MQSIAVIVPWRSNAPQAGPGDLERAMRLLTDANRELIESLGLPPLYETGVRYAREGIVQQERWHSAPLVLRAGHGDCEELASWRAAELQLAGYDAHAFFKRVATNGWHVLVSRDGAVEDPSRVLGMK